MITNEVTLVGRCTRDTEIRTTPKGYDVAELSLAVDRLTETGTSITTFVDVTAWREHAKIANARCKKGTAVRVRGHLELDKWEDKTTGEARRKLRVTADQIEILTPETQEVT